MGAEARLKGVEDKLGELSTTLLPLVETQRRQIKEHGEADKKVLEELSQYGQKTQELTAEVGTLRGIIAEMEAGRSPAARSGKGGQAFTSAGRRFTESKAYKAYRDTKSNYSSYKDGTGQLFRRRRALSREYKASSDVDASGIIIPQFQRPPLMIAQPQAIMRSLCSVVPTTETNLVKVGQETENNKLITLLTAAVASGNTVFPVENVQGWAVQIPFNAFTIDNGTTTETLTIDSIQEAAKTITTTAASTIDMVEGDRCLGSAYTFTPEGLIGPRSNKILTDLDVNIVDLVSRMVVTLNQLRDVAGLEAIIDENLLSGLGQMEDVNFFYALGAMVGIFQDPAVTKLTWSAQPGGTSILDFILNGYYGVAGDNYFPDVTLVALEVHKLLIQLKASDGHYIFWTQFQEGAPPSVFASRLLWSNLLQPTHGIVADFPKAFSIYDREQGEIEIGTPGEQFNERKRTLQAAERVGFATVRTPACRPLIFDAAP